MLEVPDVEMRYLELREEIVRSCDRCDGRGFHVDHEEDGDWKQRRCVCVDRVDRICRLIRGNVPPEFWGADQIRFTQNREQRRRVLAYSGDHEWRSGAGLILTGENGTGKTVCGCTVLIRVADHKKTVGYITSHDLISSIIRAESDREFGEWYKGLIGSYCLVIDELGKEHRKEGSDWVFTGLDDVLRRRRGMNLPTILISNFTLAQMVKTYGESFASIRRGWLEVVRFDSGDFRKEQDHVQR